jgi:hypothetical protein
MMRRSWVGITLGQLELRQGTSILLPERSINLPNRFISVYYSKKMLNCRGCAQAFISARCNLYLSVKKIKVLILTITPASAILWNINTIY